MKLHELITALTVGAFIVSTVFYLFTTKPQLSNFEKWNECINQSEGSDAECLECDALYNPENLEFFAIDINN